jgi:curli biogenesis system outer membrane secretion channel CsgG
LTTTAGYVKRIVVLPFENHSGTKFAEERFRDVVTTEILSRGLFDIVEKGEAQRFLREELVRKEQETIDLATAQRLGEDLNVEAYLAGAVAEYEEKQNGAYSYPLVSASLRLVDVKTGQIIWQASGSESGYRTVDRLFGFVSDDASTISFRLAERLLKTLQE